MPLLFNFQLNFDCQYILLQPLLDFLNVLLERWTPLFRDINELFKIFIYLHKCLVRTVCSSLLSTVPQTPFFHDYLN